MIPAFTIVACVITLFVCLFLPIICLIVYALKHRGERVVSAWFLGAVGFFVPQILIRLPLLQVLATVPGFQALAQNHLFLYTLSLAFTAGLFELVGRFAAARCLRKDLTYTRALAAGLGHGGIEAMLVIGMTYINNLIYIVMIQTGTFDTLISQTQSMGVDTAQLVQVKEALLTTSPLLFLMASVERILTIVIHCFLSVLVCYGVRTRKVLPCILLCLGFHTLLDLSAGISFILPQSASVPVIYTVLALIALVSFFALRGLKMRWPKEAEVSL